MRKYIFELEVTEGSDEFWEEVKDGDMQTVLEAIYIEFQDMCWNINLKPKRYVQEY